MLLFGLAGGAGNWLSIGRVVSLLVADAGATPVPDPSLFRISATELNTPTVRIVVDPQPGRHLITAQWVFARGATYDPAELAGLHHLVEHVAFGRISESEVRDYDELLGQIGGESEGWTDRERMGFGAVIPVGEVLDEHFDKLMALEAERWRSLVVDGDSVSRQAGVLGQETAERASGAHGRDRVRLSSLLWAASSGWSRHPQDVAAALIERVASRTATESEQAALTTAVQRAWDRLHEPGVAVLAISGGFLGPAELAAIRLHFRVPDEVAAGIAPNPGVDAVPTELSNDAETAQQPPEMLTQACEPAAPTRRFTVGSGRDAALLTAWPVRGRDHVDRIALELVARWMGGARVASGLECGEFVVERRDRQGRLGTHAAALRRSLGELAKYGLATSQIRAIAMAQATDYARALDDPALRARLAAGCTHSAGKANCVADEVQAWFSVNPKQTQIAASRWLEDSASTMLVSGVRNPLTWPPIAELRPW